MGNADYGRGEPPDGFPCWCGFFTADYVCDEHLPVAELLMKIQELESIIWDGTRQVAALEAALQQASECCARPRGVCFDPALIDGGESSG